MYRPLSKITFFTTMSIRLYYLSYAACLHLIVVDQSEPFHFYFSDSSFALLLLSYINRAHYK
jgi:hypothetical protein